MYGAVSSLPGVAFSEFTGTPTSASLEGWTAASGIPAALISQYLNLSNYKSILQYFEGTAPPQTSSFDLVLDPTPETAAPEPSALVAHLAAIALLGTRRASKRRPADRTGRPQSPARK